MSNRHFIQTIQLIFNIYIYIYMGTSLQKYYMQSVYLHLNSLNEYVFLKQRLIVVKYETIIKV